MEASQARDYCVANTATLRAACPGPSAGKMRPLQDDNPKKRGAEAPQSEATEALFQLNRGLGERKSCPEAGEFCEWKLDD